MTSLAQTLWLIPALPLLAAGLIALMKRPQRKPAAALAIGSMALAFLVSCAAFVATLQPEAGKGAVQLTHNFAWFDLGGSALRLGWLLDPLTAGMLVMVTFVGSLIFIFSVGYMDHDENFTRFFGFLALFAAAMLGLLIANNLLFLFMCWELVGVASYLLIGFWFHKPSAAAAAKKAFITTRIGDLGFFLGIVWLYHETGSLLFYDNGAGCLEQGAIAKLVAQTAVGGMAVSTAISLLLFCGAVGKSGQVPLHVWLPDAMEGPTPVSALIHAATMVAAGVFLVARVYPLMEATPESIAQLGQPNSALVASAMATPNNSTGRPLTPALSPGERENGVQPVRQTSTAQSTAARLTIPPLPEGEGRGEGKAHATSQHPAATTALQVVAWVGAITALFAALIAVAQNDIKRILAYSTVSQLGYMMLGLGVGGPAVGMFHLLTHAFFKALLFLGAGSVIHGSHHEQDIRRMGGLRKLMPVTFATYAVGMMALAGFPLVFSGFWSKDEVLHAAMVWTPSKLPFVLALFGAVLTSFYMTRQMWYVFFAPRADAGHAEPAAHHDDPHAHAHEPHESPRVMTVPLAILAVATVLLSLFATPIWPWFHAYLGGHLDHLHVGWTAGVGVVLTMILSTVAVAVGVGVSWRLYSRSSTATDAVGSRFPKLFKALEGRLYVDEFYAATVFRLNAAVAVLSDWFDRFVWGSVVELTAMAAKGLAFVSRAFDEEGINFGFDAGCQTTRGAGWLASKLQNGQTQCYLRILGTGVVALIVALAWMGKN
jgi:NADH:ubiquinone oxidoreductase subunit 5 (subunit L)/multisubunit Na+/H+ antiporter MnhA subunit